MRGILGLGVDLVDLGRIARLYRRYGEAFSARFCRPEEGETRPGEAQIQHLGGLFSAKEAVLKALGTGWGQGTGLTQVEILRTPAGPPGVRLHRRAREVADALGVERVHLSITHERGYALAVAILEGRRGALQEGDDEAG